MARFYYTTVLGEKKVSDTEINAKFANLTTAINSTKFSNEQFEISSGRYRHLKEPGTVFLYKEGVGDGIIGGGRTLSTKNGTAWNVLTNMELTVTVTRNVNTSGGPIGYICCEYESVNFDPHDYEIAIGKYTTSSSSWTHIPDTIRHFGVHNTHDATLGNTSTVGSAALYSALVQDPFNASSSVTYRPKASYAHKPLYTSVPITNKNVAGFTPTAISKYAPMIRCGRYSGGASKDIHWWDVCKFWIILEDNGL